MANYRTPRREKYICLFCGKVNKWKDNPKAKTCPRPFECRTEYRKRENIKTRDICYHRFYSVAARKLEQRLRQNLETKNAI